MHVTRLAQAVPYEAKDHTGMRCTRVQGKEAGPSQQMWMGLLHMEPGGTTGLAGSAIEKLYLVLQGEVAMICEADGQREEAVLRTWDSCRYAPGEARQLINRSQEPAVVAIVMANEAPSAQADRP